MTDAPILDLSATALHRPVRLDVVAVEAMMLWPDDDARRERWQTAAMIEAGREYLPEIRDPGALRLYAAWALDAPRLAEIQEDANIRARDGAIAGAIVLNATLYADSAPDRAALQCVIADVCDHLRGTHQLRPQTVNNKIRPLYRPVAHLWATYILACRRGDETFPCRVCDLAMFLAVAEAVRALAERPRGKARAIMQPGNAVRLPDDVLAALPAVGLALSTVTGGAG